ncbi:hypothetical protein BHE74_00040784 [Ensete ventricosum]|nr:hypothetical protein BHE74_00040784 [Ensete ventricosum]RZS15982.1 hypothetical protein BHM03_00047908 [Ensete ventricosum]
MAQRRSTPSFINESQCSLCCCGGQVIALPPQPGPAPVASTLDLGAVMDCPSSLEAIKLCHDFYSTMSIESLATIRKRYSISAEYVLHALAPRQCPYHTCPEGFSISIDALEVGLRFPLHPVIGECLG